MFDEHVRTLSRLQSRAGEDGPVALWAAITELGYGYAALPERLGGSGAEFGDVAEIARAAGHLNLAAPLADVNVVLAAVLTAAGWTAPDGVCAVVVSPSAGPTLVDHGHVASSVFVVTGDGTCSTVRELDLSGAERVRGGISRPGHVAQVRLDERPVLRETRLDQPIDQWRALVALSSSLQIDGAVSHLVDRTVRYLAVREQFGRPLLTFQALQHRVAELVTRASILTHVVDEALERWATDADTRLHLVAAATVEALGTGAAAVAAAHQLHGAIGYAQESGLGEYSTLVWHLSATACRGIDWSVELDRRVAGCSDGLWSVTAPCGTAIGERSA